MNLEVKRNKPMKNILLKYCDYKKFEYSAVNFLYLGRRVLVRSTPEEVVALNIDLVTMVTWKNR
mgnify:FL=1